MAARCILTGIRDLKWKSRSNTQCYYGCQVSFCCVCAGCYCRMSVCTLCFGPKHWCPVKYFIKTDKFRFSNHVGGISVGNDLKWEFPSSTENHALTGSPVARNVRKSTDFYTFGR
jgi:hypothetical protein